MKVHFNKSWLHSTWLRFFILALFSIVSVSVMDAKEKEDVVKILAIGNSFSVDALENHFYELAQAAGKKVVVGNMYIGGCSLKRHLVNARENKPAYKYYKRGLDGVNVKTPDYTLEAALADEQWDYVTLQQQSGKSGLYESWEESFPALLEYVRARVPEDAVIMIHQTWAYDVMSGHKDFARYDKDQMKMYTSIMDAVRKISSTTGVKDVIPCGTAVQNARTTSLGNYICRDGYHLHKIYGRYVAACTWLEKILGVNPVGNPYRPDEMTSEQQLLAQKAAHMAVRKPYKVTRISASRKCGLRN